MSTFWRGLFVVWSILAVGCWTVSTAEATHYRGGTLSYRVINASTNTIEVTLEIYMRRSYHCTDVVNTSGTTTGDCCNGSCLNQNLGNFTSQLNWGDGTASRIIYMPVFRDDKANDIVGFRRKFTHTYSLGGRYRITWSSCCWISNVIPPLSNYTLEAVANTTVTNESPQLNSPVLFNWCAGIPLNQSLNPSDPDRNTWSIGFYRYFATGGDAVSRGFSVSATGQMTWANPTAGLWIISVLAADSNLTSTYRDFLLNVRQTCNNSNPKITLNPSTITVTPGTQACTKVTASDPTTAQKLEFFVNPAKNGATAPPNGLQNNPASFTYCWTPTQADAGITHNILFTTRDNGLPPLGAQATFSVNVSKGLPPRIAIAPPGTQTVKEGGTITFTATATDPDNTGIASFTVTGLPAFCTSTKAGDKYTIECKPDYSVGTKTFTVTFTAQDKDSPPKSASEKVTIQVQDVNRPPTIQNPGTQSPKENQTYKKKIQASDPDGDTITYTMTGLPNGAKIDPTTGEITWTPGPGDVGKVYTATITVTDSKGAKASIQVTFSVGNVNDPPTITSKPPTTVYVGEDIGYTATATDPDTGDTLTWKVNKPAGATMAPKTGKMSWKPGASDAGKEIEVEVEVCDNNGACAKQTFKVKVLQKCQVDADCVLNQICVLQQNSLYLCVDPGCAPKNPKCSSNTDFCKDGACGPNPCNNVQCNPGEICRPLDGACIRPCDNVNCPAGQTCSDGTCVNDPCKGACKADEYCDGQGQTGTCKKNPCGANSCRHGRVCLKTRCIDDPCAKMQCPNPQRQQCVAGQCLPRPPCQVDIDCAGQEVCINRRCAPSGCYTESPRCKASNFVCLSAQCVGNPCQPNNPCSNGEYCRVSDSRCAKPCAGVSCAGDTKCVDGQCVNNPCAGKTCAAGEICISGSCEKDRCSTGSSVCKHGRVCSGQNTCQDDPCLNVTCPDSKQVCKNGQCVGPDNCTCDGDCPASNLCVSGKCVAPECSDTTKCAAGKTCVNGKCLDDPCTGKQCAAGEFCRSGSCIKTCAGVFCDAGKVCVDGTCKEDPCNGKQCSGGESCLNGQCTKDTCQGSGCTCRGGRVCRGSRCVDNPCALVTCPSGQACQNGQCTGDLPCKVDVDCPGAGICVGGKCGPPGCYSQACTNNQRCLNGTCNDDPCAGKTCPDGSTCRPTDGQCVTNCPTCPQGQRCENGQCVSDPCADKTCPQGQRCVNGTCEPDICERQGVKPCRYTRSCNTAGCGDDPCANMQCAADQTCREGVCYKPPAAPEAGPEPGPEPTPEAGPEGQRRMEIYISGGCFCSAQTTPWHNAFYVGFVLFFLLLLSSRRRHTQERDPS